ncbi:neurogenic locus notch homolog protein 3 [Hyalella azteca]|uniref:Neurogenic locus notch homolog protein 3 n=1 Tax=Hyalella azteca TaxID=294128 RepID=A0A8B7NGG5_HYAAZ|nr:neurogenic locus notch homolog protein 3 [Hyalella azteca]
MQLSALVLAALVCGSATGQRALPLSSFQYPSAPLLPIAPLYEFAPRVSLPPISRSTTTAAARPPSPVGESNYIGSSDPCTPSPCGPNTLCEVNSQHIALCRCQPNFVPDQHTIRGCKPQCLSDRDCPDDYACTATKCVRLCSLNECGIDAICKAYRHKAECSCPPGYLGNPAIYCAKPERDPTPAYVDPCTPNPCGANAQCTSNGAQAVCSCLQRHAGNPLEACVRQECAVHSDCSAQQVCRSNRCIDPCSIPNICGTNTDCTARDRQPVCSCRSGYVGDPFTSCRRFDPQELCRPSPCGRNTNCQVQGERAVCTCLPNYVGDPLTGCRPECERDSHCPANFACQNNRCVNPCQNGVCGDGALCNVRNGVAVCTCPEFYLGNPYTRCYPECTTHEECPAHQACFKLRCIDPCVGACGSGAECRVELHKPICSCPKGFTGHPFESCRPFDRSELCRPNPCGSNADCTPGHDRDGNDRPVCTCPRGYVGNPLQACIRGECETDRECRSNEACYEYKCQSTCHVAGRPVCGRSADCTMRNHVPVCTCPTGFDGNPLISCSPHPRSRYAIGRT